MIKISKNGINKLIEWEGFENNPYYDDAGYLTIGVGHLLTRSELSSGSIVINEEKVSYKSGLTFGQVEGLLDQDIVRYENEVSSGVKVNINQNQADAIISFCFNVGRTAFRNSTLLKKLNKGELSEVPSQLNRWIYSGGRKSNGLINRRHKEIVLWNTIMNIDAFNEGKKACENGEYMNANPFEQDDPGFYQWEAGWVSY